MGFLEHSGVRGDYGSADDWREVSPAADRAIEDLFRLLRHLSDDHTKDYERRVLVCTPCGGQYERVAFWLVTVNGSPPRGSLVLQAWHSGPAACAGPVFFFDAYGRTRRLGSEQERVAHDFAREFLSEREIDRARPVVVRLHNGLGQCEKTEGD
jgi:hypothetical protein